MRSPLWVMPVRQRGFTLVETIVVITILAVIAAIATPRFTDDRAFAERGYFDELTNALRVGQRIAVASGCPVRVVVTASGYDARQQGTSAGRCDPGDSSWPTPIMLPDGSTLSGTAPSGVTVNPSTTFVFDVLGATSLGADETLTVGSFALVIHANSGYVETP